MRIVIIALFFLSHYSFAQSKRAVFQMLPKDCTPGLSAAERDSLWVSGAYILPGGNEEETIKYTLDTTSDWVYFTYQYYYTTGQRGFLSFEVLSLPRGRGRVVLFSRVGGVPVMFYQQELRFFNLVNGRLAESKEKLLPLTPDLKQFFSANTPDSILARIDHYVSYSYDLNTEFEDVISFRVLFDGGVEKYKVKDIIYFRWNGRRFVEEEQVP